MPSKTATAESQARSQVASILGLYLLHETQDVDDLDADVADVLADYGIDRHTIVSEDHCQELARNLASQDALHCELTWKAPLGQHPDPSDPDAYRIDLCCGGPAIWLEGSFGALGQACLPVVYFNWWGEHGSLQSYDLTDMEKLALTWYAHAIAVR
jgi:hypothetical protein